MFLFVAEKRKEITTKIHVALLYSNYIMTVLYTECIV